MLSEHSMINFNAAKNPKMVRCILSFFSSFFPCP